MGRFGKEAPRSAEDQKDGPVGWLPRDRGEGKRVQCEAEAW